MKRLIQDLGVIVGMFAFVVIIGLLVAFCVDLLRVVPDESTTDQVAACAHQCERFGLEIQGVTLDASGVRECYCARWAGP